MNKTIIPISLATLAVCVLAMCIFSSSQLAYARENSKRVAEGEFHQVIVRTDDKKYKIDGNYDVEINDDNTLAITKNDDASNTKT